MSTGNEIAANLKACQIISGRDVERVAKQIDAGIERDLAAANARLAEEQEKFAADRLELKRMTEANWDNVRDANNWRDKWKEAETALREQASALDAARATAE